MLNQRLNPVAAKVMVVVRQPFFDVRPRFEVASHLLGTLGWHPQLLLADASKYVVYQVISLYFLDGPFIKSHGEGPTHAYL